MDERSHRTQYAKFDYQNKQREKDVYEEGKKTSKKLSSGNRSS